MFSKSTPVRYKGHCLWSESEHRRKASCPLVGHRVKPTRPVMWSSSSSSHASYYSPLQHWRFSSSSFLNAFMSISREKLPLRDVQATSRTFTPACPSVAQGVRRKCSNFARLISLWSRSGIRDFGGKWKEHLLPMSNTSHVGLGKAARVMSQHPYEKSRSTTHCLFNFVLR